MVAPNASASVAGNASNALPSGPVSIELQEIVGAGQLPSTPIEITGLSFRAAPGTGPISATVGSPSIYLSTSPNVPNSKTSGFSLMSPTFAQNVGPDKTLVFSGSNITWSDAGCAAPGPCPYDITIQFTTPFYYSDATGTLLIDMLETNLSAKSGATDVSSTAAPGDGVAQVLGTLGNGGGSPAATILNAGPSVTMTPPSGSPIVLAQQTSGSGDPYNLIYALRNGPGESGSAVDHLVTPETLG